MNQVSNGKGHVLVLVIGLMLPVREFCPVFGWRLKIASLFGWFTQWKNAFA